MLQIKEIFKIFIFNGNRTVSEGEVIVGNNIVQSEENIPEFDLACWKPGAEGWLLVAGVMMTCDRERASWSWPADSRWCSSCRTPPSGSCTGQRTELFIATNKVNSPRAETSN